MDEKKWQPLIHAYALDNALSHDGKSQAGAVLSHLFNEGLNKDEIKDIMPLIQQEIKKINSLNIEKQKKEFESYEKYVKKHEEKEKGLKELPNAKMGKVVTRLAPEPSKYNHLGHAMSFLLNYLYAKKYKGKCKLRFEDTNPEKVEEQYVQAMKEDLIEYLGIKPDEIHHVSDDMSKLYKYAEKLIKLEKAYICFCERDQLKELRDKGIECGCRQKPKERELREWKKFLKGEYKEGQAILRLKGEMQSNNYVMRDPVLFRVMDKEHYRHKKKYKVWPMYDFYNPIEDSLMGVTHILRTNEFDVRVELQDLLKDLLKLKKQTIVQYGRIGVIDATTKGRETRELVESGEYLGWDDPRLVTLKALKRRGIVRESFYQLAEEAGLTKHEVRLSFDMIAAINRKIIDKTSDRYSFVPDPQEIIIQKKPAVDAVDLKLHPDKDETRVVKIGKSLFISKEDEASNKNKEIRLMHLFNIKLQGNGKAEFTSSDNKNIPKLNWVSESVKARVLMPDAKWIDGLTELAVKSIKPGTIIQFERFGFVRFDRFHNGIYEFWFGHK